MLVVAAAPVVVVEVAADVSVVAASGVAEPEAAEVDSGAAEADADEDGSAPAARSLVISSSGMNSLHVGSSSPAGWLAVDA